VMGRGLLRTRILGILGLVIIAVASWVFIISPRLEEPSLLEATANSATDQSAALKSQVSLLEQQEKALPQAEQAADSIATRFTPSPDVPFLIEQIEGAAGRAGMSPDQVLGIIPTAPVLTVAVAPAAPAAPAAGASPDPNASAAPAAGSGGGGGGGGVQTARMDVKISIKGTYQQITEFLVQLQTSDRVVIVDNVSIAAVSVDTAGTTVTNPDGTTTVVPPVSTEPMYQVEIAAHVILIQALPSVQNDIPQNPNGTATPEPSSGASPAATISPTGASSASPSASSTKKPKKPKASASAVASPTPVPVVTEQPVPVDSGQPVPVPSDQPVTVDSGQPAPGVTIVPTPSQ